MASREADLVRAAKPLKAPIAWLHLEDEKKEEHVIVLEGKLLVRAKNWLDAFIYYFTAFTTFMVSWMVTHDDVSSFNI